jgi:hypothetical protein
MPGQDLGMSRDVAIDDLDSIQLDHNFRADRNNSQPIPLASRPGLATL